MAKKPIYKYGFVYNKTEFLLSVGESAPDREKNIVNVVKYSKVKNELMNNLWYTVNNSNWLYLEQGQRTPTGAHMDDFKRYKVKLSPISDKTWLIEV